VGGCYPTWFERLKLGERDKLCEGMLNVSARTFHEIAKNGNRNEPYRALLGTNTTHRASNDMATRS
jgi:hypothetical protein